MFYEFLLGNCRKDLAESTDDYDFAQKNYDRISMIYYKNKNSDYKFKWNIRLVECKNTTFDMRFVNEDDTDYYEATLECGEESMVIIKPIDYYSDYDYDFETDNEWV